MRLSLSSIALVLLAAGCAAPAPREPAQTQAPRQVATTQGASDVVERIQADPPGFLREVFGRSDALPAYRLTFYRQERLGLIPRLTPMERIRATFRKEPFSVHFSWPDPDSAYAESVYVAGQNDGKLIVRERKGLLGLPPTTRTLNPGDPVRLGLSKNPITDFGLSRVARRTIDALNDPQVREQTRVTYEGVVTLEPVNRPAYLLRIERPTSSEIQYPRQDFFVDTQTLLPAGTDLYLPGGTLDARYRYADVDVNVDLTDEDFRLSGS